MAADGLVRFSLLQEQVLGWAGAIVYRLDTGGQHCKELSPVRWKEPPHAGGTWVFISAITQPEPSGDLFCPLLPPGRFLLKKFTFGTGAAQCRYSPGHALTPNNSSNSSYAASFQTQLRGSLCTGAQVILASLQGGCPAKVGCKEILVEGLRFFSLNSSLRRSFVCTTSATSSGSEEDGLREDGVLTSKTCAKWRSAFSWVLVHDCCCSLWLNQHRRDYPPGPRKYPEAGTR